MTRLEIRSGLEAYAKHERRAHQDWTDHEWAIQVQALTGLAILELVAVLEKVPGEMLPHLSE